MTDPALIDDLLRRIAKLEREQVQLRKGAVTAGSPLGVALGGSAVSASGVRALYGATIDNGAQVAALEQGNDLVVLGGIGATLGLPFVTSLPSPAYDGQIVLYDTGTDGVVWAFRYDAGSASAYKWQFIGGPPLTSLVDNLGSLANTAYNDIGVVGPSITLPAIAGDFNVEHGCRMIAGTATAHEGFMSYSIAGGAASDANAASSISSGQFDGGTVQQFRPLTALAASTSFVCKYRTQTANNYDFSKRWLAITPVRVG